MEYKPPLYNSIYFNSALFSSKDDLLTMDDADRRYLRISGGYVAYLSTTMFVYNGDNINLSLLASVTPGIATASKTIILDSSSNISGINSLSCTTFSSTSIACTTLFSTNITGTLQTAAQPNITSLGSLTSLSLRGTAITSTATEINTLTGITATTAQLNYLSGIVAGGAAASKALVLDSSKNITGINSLTSTNLTGILQTASQPNITSLGSLTSLTTSSIALGGTTIISTATEINTLHGITTTTSELNILHGVTTTTAQLNYLTVTAGTAIASKALTLDSSSNITGINGLTLSSYFYNTSTGKGQYVGNWTNTSNWSLGPDTTSADNTVRLGVCSNSGVWTGAYCNLKLLNLTTTGDVTIGGWTRVNTGQITLNNIVMSSTAQELNLVNGVTAGSIVAGRAIAVDSSKNIAGFNSLSSNSLTAATILLSGYCYNSSANTKGLYIGNWSSAAYWGIGADTSSNDSILRLGICDTAGNWSGYANVHTATLMSSKANIGTATAGSSHNLNIMNTGADASLRIGSDTASNNAFGLYFTYAGNGSSSNTLQFNSTSTGSILSMNAVGNVGINTAGSSFNLEVRGPSSNMLRLYDASLLHGLAVYSSTNYISILAQDGNSNLTLGTGGTSFLSITNSVNQKVGIGGLGTTYPFEVNTSYTITASSSYGYLNSGGSTGTRAAVSANYSCWFKDRINVTGEVNVTSDKRIKRNIEDLSLDRVVDFIKKIEPKSFIKQGEIKKSFGLMAQDVYKLGFEELVNLTPCDIEETVDKDGFISPRGYIFNLNYDGLTCINTKIIQYLLFKLEALESLIRDEF